MRLVSDAFYRRYGLFIGVGKPYFFLYEIKQSGFAHKTGVWVCENTKWFSLNSMFSDTDKI
jgi:hypothetical protein